MSTGTLRKSSLLTLITAVLALQPIGCGKKASAQQEGAKAEQPANQPKEVKLVPVTEAPIEQTIEISGTLDADEQVTVGAKVPGRLASIAVDLASAVESGQIIAQIETRDYELKVEQASASLAQARAQLGLAPDAKDGQLDVEGTAIVRQAGATLKEAQTNLERSRKLAAEGLVSGMDLDAAVAAAARAESAMQSAREEVRIREATMRQRRSELNMARQQLTDTIVRSPISGIIQARRVNVGEYLAAGAPIADIVRIDPLRLRVAIPEIEAADVRKGQPVRVIIQGDQATHTGEVARLAPALDPQSRTLLVESDIKNPGHLRPGSLVRAQIIVSSKPAPTVPETALIRFAGLTKVITVENGKAKEKQVTTGKASGDRVEIVSGVKAGESVVDKPGSLQQGQPVRVMEGS
jgi:RND family efflux transporter MFP subunit